MLSILQNRVIPDRPSGEVPLRIKSVLFAALCVGYLTASAGQAAPFVQDTAVKKEH